ncbi:MAG: hypothetical protein II046_08975 [Clostridiales bacterium]|nr:hypothetical protein [Clostridiales bacterium]
MSTLFFKVLEMSLMGSVVILITILARFLLRNRSKRFIMILWAVVALRLIVPFGFESAFSIFNYLPLPTQAAPAIEEVSEAALPDNNSGAYEAPVNYAEFNNADAPAAAEVPGDQVKEAPSDNKAVVKTLPDFKSVVAVIWFTGMVVLTTYFSIRFIDLKDKLKNARKIDRHVYESDNVRSPFVFGLFVPKMYLPDTLDEAEREYVMAHERTHIRHGDWIKKYLGIAVLAIHWFNPLVWLAFVFFEQDIEMSCDETTISSLDAELRKAYAISIVSYAKASNNSNKKYMVTPLGFSKNAFCKAEVKKRVMNIVNFKKGTKVTTIVILAAVLVLAAACALNSKPDSKETAVSTTASEADTKESDTTAASEETPIQKMVTNEHKFENGACKDCGMLWTDYYYETLSKLDKDDNGEWKSVYGPTSDAMLNNGDYVQFYSSDPDASGIHYQCMDARPVSEGLDVGISKDGKKTTAYISWELAQGSYPIEPGVINYKFRYCIDITADAGDFDKVFESKEAFAKRCNFCLFVWEDGNSYGTDVWSSMKEDDIKKMFEGQEDCTFYTKEQMIDMFWSHYSNMLQSIDNSLIMMDTSLADAGVNWKK